MLSVIVPCTDARDIEAKVIDCSKLRGIDHEVIICYNGPRAGAANAQSAVAAASGVRIRLCESEPFNKNGALRAGLRVASFNRILYTDVDCRILETPDTARLSKLLEEATIISFPVLRSQKRLHRFLATLRRRVLSKVWPALDLYFLSIRGGGYVCGNFMDLVRGEVCNDDLLYPLEYAESVGREVVHSEELMFYEHGGSSTNYVNKIPRLIYGSFQAARLTRFARVRLSIVLQKHVRFFAVGLYPVLAAAACAVVGLPVFLAALTIVHWRWILKTWEGILAGILDRPPRWMS
jgi:hypothetical protein